jgi:hypothetical protein
MIRIFLKESRAEQLRRELDDVVNGTDYGSSIQQADSDPTVARAKGLEVDDNPTTQPEKPEVQVQYYNNGQKMTEQYSLGNGILVRKNYYDSGKKHSEAYRLNGEYHRVDSPAYASWYRNGKKASEQYFFRGQCHRVDGPAYSSWDDEGRKTSEEYRIDGKNHRTTGPAYRGWDESGEIIYELYYLNGISFSKERWLEVVKKINRNYLDLNEPSKSEYKFTKNRKRPSDPRFANLDLSDNQPPQKTDDKELEGRAKGLEVEPPKTPNAYKFTKNRKPEGEQRYKALELDEKLSRIRKEFERLL